MEFKGGSNNVSSFKDKYTESAPIRKCYECDSTEHLARDCTNRRIEIKCFKCNQIGHVASRCFSVREV